jgi:hypothetical protein
MKLGFKIIEKVIAIALIMIGVLMIYLLAESFNNIMRFEQYHPTMKPKIALFGFLRHTNASILIFLAAIFGGILLFLNRKVGWIIAMIALLSYTLLIVTNILFDRKRFTMTLDQDDHPILLIVGLSLIFAVPLVIMILKPFRLKYSPTMKTYLIIVGVSVSILIDYSFRL